jgi:hypothetical protein
MENQEKTSENQVVRNEKGQIIKGTANPYGRPKGVLNFATKFRAVVEKIAEKDGITPEQVEQELIAVGFKNAKDGNYNFWKDLHDRVYGQATKVVEIDGKFEINEDAREKARKALGDI